MLIGTIRLQHRRGAGTSTVIADGARIQHRRRAGAELIETIRGIADLSPARILPGTGDILADRPG